MTRPHRLVLLGHPVSHSLSPQIQNAALRAAGLSMDYEPIDVSPTDLHACLSDLAREQGGGNITLPHKTAASKCMGSHTSQARVVGAVNTFKPDGRGGLIGHNTDVEGFDALARTVIPIRAGLQVAVIGAGGGAAAVLAAVSKWPSATAQLFARNQHSAKQLTERFSDFAGVAGGFGDEAIPADIVVNATPIGLADESFPVELERLHPGCVVLDLAYRAGETAWVKAAKARGHRAADGITMLVEQAAAAFKWWFDLEPDREAMRRAAGASSKG